MQIEWKANDGLRVTNKNAATKTHPITGETVWFNHTQVFHLAAAAFEYHKIHQRQKRWETFKTSILLEIMTFYKKLTKISQIANTIDQIYIILKNCGQLFVILRILIDVYFYLLIYRYLRNYK